MSSVIVRKHKRDLNVSPEQLFIPYYTVETRGIMSLQFWGLFSASCLFRKRFFTCPIGCSMLMSD